MNQLIRGRGAPTSTEHGVRSTGTRNRKHSALSMLAAAALATTALVGLPGAAAPAAAMGPMLLDANYELIEFYAYTGTLSDIAIGPGTGEFGNDLIAADGGNFNNSFDGGFRRFRDLNGDGDAKDAGESEQFLTNAVRSPLSIDIGYGGDLYFQAYPSSSASRFVYKVTNAATPAVSQYTSNSVFNPNTLEFVPQDGGGELLTVSASQAFTAFGGTNDGRIFQAPLAATGTVASTVWSAGTNIASGSPAGWWDMSYGRGTMPDGPFGPNWVIVNNQIAGGRPLWAIKDITGDGDTDDAGESRLLLDDGFGYGEWIFDDDGVGYATTSTQVYRFKDLNNDGDFWDAGAGDVDAGEKELFIDGLPGSGHPIEFGPDGEMYVIGTAAGLSAGAAVNIYLVRPIDTDSDGVADIDDNCVDDPNPGQENQDGDTLGDACDPDADGDNTDDTTDNCIGLANPGQENQDGDTLGDACDPDADGDNTDDTTDNCIGLANPGQENQDGDALGDACDDNDDNDAALDVDDAFPLDPAETNDNDMDGVGDNADLDDDNDMQTDAHELECGSDPNDASSTSPDTDGDNAPDCVDPIIPVEPIDPPANPAPWTSIIPARYLETRVAPTATTFDGDEQGIGRRTAGQVTMFDIGGRGAVPADAAGAIVNLTAINPSGVGFLTAYGCGTEQPNASSLNYSTQVTLGNEVIADLDDDGMLCVFTSAATDLAVDVVGFTGSDSLVELVAPARIVESRDRADLTTVDGESQGKGALDSETELTFQVAGRGGVADDAAAAILNVTAINPELTGFFTVHPCLDELPLASSLNYVAGVNRGNEIVVELDDDGQACLFTSALSHVTVDVVGFLPDTSSFMSVGPARFLDTRTGPAAATIDGDFQGDGRLVAGNVLELDVVGRAGVTADAKSVVMNVTAVRPAGTGFVTMWPCGEDQPLTATLNFVGGVSGGTEVIAGIGDGMVCIFNQTETDMTIDVTAFTTS